MTPESYFEQFSHVLRCIRPRFVLPYKQKLSITSATNKPAHSNPSNTPGRFFMLEIEVDGAGQVSVVELCITIDARAHDFLDVLAFGAVSLDFVDLVCWDMWDFFSDMPFLRFVLMLLTAGVVLAVSDEEHGGSPVCWCVWASHRT